ncbi:acyltransferase family protein [Salisediminibacterium selenitireducens]|uniref:Acyltransferase 3 n=1 Tax=Bacillus selenitireducens (strain ATCC 700615 / DSM 15326 / MLS10) TaxID=439292 RepID=D6Y0I9_BACIE|nr:acyltransferase family protein [Salisediminibacterium selenitireducens]ADI00557.1 acyltransferase 3 [[Bacillus] selenitireducens MLS10]
MNDLTAPEKKFRPEIEGTRALAAILVAVYHIWIGTVSGGVDVFFIVSGFLITTSLVLKMDRDGGIRVGHFYAGLLRRLLPISLIVLMTTGIASILLLPQLLWNQTASELIASLFYFQNWQLAFDSVDYLAQNNEASPFQHYWALSLQGQFYLIWPLVILFGYALARRLLHTPPRLTLLMVFLIVFAASLAYSVHLTAVNQPWAYFNSFARVWEFAMGGILALTIAMVRLPKMVSFFAGWLGVGIIAFTGTLLPVADVFPGYAALLPTSGALLVMIAAQSPSAFGAATILGSRVFTYLGSISYGFYLWHWPLFIFYLRYTGTDQPSLLAGLAIIVASAFLSHVSTRIVEAPFRRMQPQKHLKRITWSLSAMATPVLLLAGGWLLTIHLIQSDGSFATDTHPGALAIHNGLLVPENVDPIPSTIDIENDIPAFYSEPECYTSSYAPEVVSCSYGETEDADLRIAMVGGSHVGHWFTPMVEIAERHHIEIELYNKDACRFTTSDFDGRLTESCLEWNEDIIDVLNESDPDMIFTTANVAGGRVVHAGYIDQWRQLEHETPVFAIRDNPRMPANIPLCLEEQGEEACTPTRNSVLSDVDPWENTEEPIPDHTFYADLSEYFCDDDWCYPVIGNVVVYRDEHHISDTYAKTLTEPLEEHILEALDHFSLMPDED